MYIFDLKTLKFTTSSEMRTPKTFNGIIHYHEGLIYAFGGNEKDICERYDTYSNKWDNVVTYAENCRANELNGWCQVYCPATL